MERWNPTCGEVAETLTTLVDIVKKCKLGKIDLQRNGGVAGMRIVCRNLNNLPDVKIFDALKTEKEYKIMNSLEAFKEDKFDEFYAEEDVPGENMHCVFGGATGFAYGSYCNLEEAENHAELMNKANEHHRNNGSVE